MPASIAPEGLGGSMQGLIFAATTGVGLFLGTQLAGFAMDKYTVDGKFQWPKIWAFPLVITLVGTLVFATAFQGKVPEKEAEDGGGRGGRRKVANGACKRSTRSVFAPKGRAMTAQGVALGRICGKRPCSPEGARCPFTLIQRAPSGLRS